MKVLVIFGSQSDNAAFEPIREGLTKKDIATDMRLLSAHRTPREVDEIDFNSYCAIVAGAGLAAHLPGVVAARTIKPVFGVPFAGAYDGLDSFLSIAQMPPGIPVLATGVGAHKNAIDAISTMKEKQGIQLCFSSSGKAIDAARNTLERFGAKFTEERMPSADKINIVFFDTAGKPDIEGISIVCPTAITTSAADAAPLMAKASKGLWVGVNQGENAALAALQLSGKYTDKLLNHKEEIRQKALAIDRALNYG